MEKYGCQGHEIGNLELAARTSVLVLHAQAHHIIDQIGIILEMREKTLSLVTILEAIMPIQRFHGLFMISQQSIVGNHREEKA